MNCRILNSLSGPEYEHRLVHNLFLVKRGEIVYLGNIFQKINIGKTSSWILFLWIGLNITCVELDMFSTSYIMFWRTAVFLMCFFKGSLCSAEIDSYTEPLPLNGSIKDVFETIVEENKHLPDECRKGKNLCHKNICKHEQ